MAWLLLVVFTLISQFRFNSCCLFHAISTNRTLDLTKLQNKTIHGNNTEYRYIYTPCGNSAQCISNNSVLSTMINQINKNDETCIRLAYWDHGQVQPEYDPYENRFIFKYFNGDKCPIDNNTSIEMQIYWECDMHINDYSIISVGLMENCTYEMYILSKLACNITSSNTTHAVHFSTGTWIVISFFVLVALYCIFGACFNVNSDDGNAAQMPHHQFWMTLPLWVIAGFEVTRDFICCRTQEPLIHNNLANTSRVEMKC
eukprot:336081_1